MDLNQGPDHVPIYFVFFYVLQLCQAELRSLLKIPDEEAIKETA
jgi:hypothetical protein